MIVLDCLEQGKTLIVKDPDSKLLRHLEPLFEMRKKQYDIKARNINTSLKTESETDETPTDSTSKYKIKSRKQETKEKFISVDYHGAHRLAKSSFQLYVVFTDQYYHLKLSNTMREMSSNISFDFHNDSKIIKDIISDSVL